MASSSIPAYPVEVGFSRSIARLTGHHLATLPLNGIAPLAAVSMADEPLTLFDINGEPLFHDYLLIDAGAAVGTIRTAASRKLGSPLISINHTPPGWTPDSALRLATESLHAMEPTAVVQDWQLVIYAHPKVGIRLNYSVPANPPVQSQIFDAASGHAVASSTDQSHQFTRYSLLDSLPSQEVSTRLARFADAERQVEQLRADRPEQFAPRPATEPLVPRLNIFPIGIRMGIVHWSPFCPNSPVGLTHYTQITDFFCVDASAQMLMEHYGWNYTQNQIAVAMGTSQANGGTTGVGLTTGFASLTHNSLTLTFDDGVSRDQQFQDAMSEINANRPLFTQVPHHYRVCAGYFEDVINLIFVTLGLNQMIYIYDPWPWNPDECQGGAIYWESWATSPVMWFGIVHHA